MLYCRNPKTVKYGAETIPYLAPKIWFLVPEIIKSSKALDIFRNLRHSAVAGTSRIYKMGRFYENSLQI